jgi:hypothetical protein
MGKSTISMAIFNSYVKLPEGKFSHSFSGRNTTRFDQQWPQVLLEKLEEVLLESLTWNDGWNFAPIYGNSSRNLVERDGIIM